jgi:hypothetical protein
MAPNWTSHGMSLHLMQMAPVGTCHGMSLVGESVVGHFHIVPKFFGFKLGMTRRSKS